MSSEIVSLFISLYSPVFISLYLYFQIFFFFKTGLNFLNYFLLNLFSSFFPWFFGPYFFNSYYSFLIPLGFFFQNQNLRKTRFLLASFLTSLGGFPRWVSLVSLSPLTKMVLEPKIFYEIGFLRSQTYFLQLKIEIFKTGKLKKIPEILNTFIKELLMETFPGSSLSFHSLFSTRFPESPLQNFFQIS